tara:strand:+ start:794 stop:1366 length:573 start_codon:yes stop_codon:yes gene_type:complete
MKYVIMVVLMLVSTPLLASVNTHGLSDKQVAELQANVAQMKLENTSNELTMETVTDIASDPEMMDKWAKMGEGVAKAIGATAKELGIATNDFLDSDAGKLAAFLVIYHVFGAELLTFLVGMFIVLPISLFVMHRMVRGVYFDGYVTDEKGKRRPKYLSTKELSDGASSSITAIYIVGAILTFIQIGVYLP